MVMKVREHQISSSLVYIIKNFAWKCLVRLFCEWVTDKMSGKVGIKKITQIFWKTNSSDLLVVFKSSQYCSWSIVYIIPVIVLKAHMSSILGEYKKSLNKFCHHCMHFENRRETRRFVINCDYIRIKITEKKTAWFVATINITIKHSSNHVRWEIGKYNVVRELTN